MTIPENLFNLILIIQLWSLPWKGLALWKAAKTNSVKWFIPLLVINTAAILEIIYLFLIPPKVKFTFKKASK